MKVTFVPLASLFALVPLVAGHGWVDYVSIDGKKYDGNSPNSNSVQSPIRSLSDNGPATLATDPQDLPCGRGSKNAALVADAMPGSKYTLDWITSGGGNWVHKVGPIMAYMASCGSTPCDQFDASQAQWFKIAQLSFTGGKDPETGGLQWWQGVVSEKKPIDIMLPENLAPGGYLIRQEIISMQNIPVEFYASCTQVNIGGSGTGKPDNTFQFPAAYSSNDPAFSQNLYGDKVADTFIFPGPPLSNLANPNQNPGSTAGVAGGSGGTNSSAPASGAGGDPQTSQAGAAQTSMVAAPSGQTVISSAVGTTSTFDDGMYHPSSAAAPTPTAVTSSAAAPPATEAASSDVAPSATGALSQPASSGKCGVMRKRRENVQATRADRFIRHVAQARRDH